MANLSERFKTTERWQSEDELDAARLLELKGQYRRVRTAYEQAKLQRNRANVPKVRDYWKAQVRKLGYELRQLETEIQMIEAKAKQPKLF